MELIRTIVPIALLVGIKLYNFGQDIWSDLITNSYIRLKMDKKLLTPRDQLTTS